MLENVTLEELRENAKRVYPASLKEVKANKYKVNGYDGYLLLDDTKDNKVPQLFYCGKWRENTIHLQEDQKAIVEAPINFSKNIQEKKVTIDTHVYTLSKHRDDVFSMLVYRLKDGINEGYDKRGTLNDIIQDFPITKDNIHLYYEFMSDEDKNAHIELIDGILYSRLYIVITDKLKIENFSRFLNKTYGKDTASFIAYDFFGVKDTLKPIDEYIEEIKASIEYKEYIANKSIQ